MNRTLNCIIVLAMLVIAAPARGDVRVDRFYTDSRYGQLHVHRAVPARPSQRPPLVLFHQTPLSGRVYADLLPHLAGDRIVYAVDTPGYGESDPPPEPVLIEDYAAAIGDFLDDLAGPVDVFGYHTGVLIALELAVTRPGQVRNVVLVAIPLFDDERRQSYVAKPTELSDDGAHLTAMWESSMSVRADGQTTGQIARIVAEKQRAGTRAWWAGPAIFAYDTAAALGRVAQPALVLRPKDGLWEQTGNAVELIDDVTVVERTDWGYGFFDARPAEVAEIVVPFLDESAAGMQADPDPTSILSRLAIVVADLEASKRFYTYALGYDVTFEGDIGRPIVKTQLGIDPEQTASFVVLSNNQVINGVRRDAAMIGLLSIGNPELPVMRRPRGHDLATGEGMLAVRTTDIGTVFERLQELDARILLEPLTSPDGRERELVVHDPDGVRLHVVERADR